jgi:hypothetical protein
MANVPSGLNLTPPQETKKKKKEVFSCFEDIYIPQEE